MISLPLILLLLHITTTTAFSNTQTANLAAKAQEMLDFSLDSYHKYAFPEDELNPLECSGVSRKSDDADSDNWGINDVLGNYSLTLIDSLDVLVVVGDVTAFHNAVDLVIKTVKSFDLDSRVQVFEVTIRILGGLISAHLFLVDTTLGFLKKGYKDELLKLSIDLGDRLLPVSPFILIPGV
jgi:mannosidase alpha-like ER degradation enhancer 1